MEKRLFQEGGNYFVTEVALCNGQRESVGVRLRLDPGCHIPGRVT